ncbi:MAG: recombinase RecA [Solobacterium sp.]|nr:recombinase RecA [Solobacterium sp.]
MAKETKPVTDDKKDQLLADALKAIEKEYGKGSIMRLGDRAEVSVDAIPSGSLALDQALGIGGYPKGRIVEIYGPESSGKTTLALHAIAECQKQGDRCAFIDAENAIDPVYAKNLGVDIDELILSQPDSGEQALEITELLIKSGAIDLVVIDSVAALVPQAELDGEMSDASVGLQARLMSKAMRKLAGVMNRSNTTAIFINQLREKVGIMFGNPETTPGGRALKFYASVRLDVRKGETLKNGSDVIGNTTKIKVVKNKVAPPFRTAVVNMIYGEGISHLDEIINLAVENDIIDKSGAWFSYNGEKIGQGFQSVREYMKKHPEFDAEVTEKVKAKIFPDPSQTESEKEEA